VCIGTVACAKRFCSNFHPARITKLAAPTKTGTAARPITTGRLVRGAGSAACAS
jgi:hypothetical protein